MAANPSAKILLAFAVLFSVLTGCGGDNSTAAPESEPAAEMENLSKDEDAANQPDEENPQSDSDTLIALVQALMPSDDVPQTFIECWIDETLNINGLSAEELLDLLLGGDEDEKLDGFNGDVVQTCIGVLSAEDFAAVLASGILDEDEDDAREGQVFPDVDAPDLFSDPLLADEGIEIVVSPGFTDGYLWSGAVKGAGMPPGIATAIFGCAGSFETVMANIFEACDFDQPVVAFIDDQGNFVATVNDPVPTSPEGTCIIVTTDPDDNPDTDDGPGAIVCSNSDNLRGQTLPEETAADLLSNPAFTTAGAEVIVSPGIVDGYLWSGTISGTGFTPGEVVAGVGCGGTYENILEVIPFACDTANPFVLGIVDENGTFASEPGPPSPTAAEGTCLLMGTDPDNNPDTDDGQGTIICTR
jgi:hypothetical protein